MYTAKKECYNQAKKLTKQYESKIAKREKRKETQDKVIETFLGLSQQFLKKELEENDKEEKKQDEFDEVMDFLDATFDEHHLIHLLTKSELLNVKKHLLRSSKIVIEEHKRLKQKYNDDLRVYQKLVVLVESL